MARGSFFKRHFYFKVDLFLRFAAIVITYQFIKVIMLGSFLPMLYIFIDLK